MRKRLAVLFGIVLVASCGTPAPPPDDSPSAPLAATPAGRPPAPPPAEPEVEVDRSPLTAPRWVRTEVSGIALEVVVFDSRSHRLLVADQPGGPGTLWPDARAAGGSLGGIAAVNAGFFTPLGDPLGRLVVDGRSTGSLNRSSLGAGFFLEDRSGQLALIRRQRFSNARHALQSGPFLVENGRAVSGLSPVSSGARSFIAHDGGSRWMIARSGACSLAQLADALAAGAPAGIKIESALNLDGGRSSEIWAAGSVQGGPAFTRPVWNRPVRNFLVLVPRP